MLRAGGVNELIVLLTLIIPMAYLMNRARKGASLPKLKSIGAVDALPDSVDRAVETGRPVVASTGGFAALVGQFASAAVAGVRLIRYIAKLCYMKGARFIAVAGITPDLVPYIDAVLKEEALSQGKTESYVRSRDLKFFAGAYNLSLPELIETEKAATYVLLGTPYGGDFASWESANRVGALFVGGCIRFGVMGPLALAADYLLLMDEVYAAGAMVGGDKEELATLIASDFTKLYAIVLVVVLSILAFLGVNISGLLAI